MIDDETIFVEWRNTLTNLREKVSNIVGAEVDEMSFHIAVTILMSFDDWEKFCNDAETISKAFEIIISDSDLIGIRKYGLEQYYNYKNAANADPNYSEAFNRKDDNND